MMKNVCGALRLLVLTSLILASLSSLLSAGYCSGGVVSCSGLSGRECTDEPYVCGIDYPKECFKLEAGGYCELSYAASLNGADCVCSTGSVTPTCSNLAKADCAKYESGTPCNNGFCRFNEDMYYICNNVGDADSLPCSKITDSTVCTKVGCSWGECRPLGVGCDVKADCCAGLVCSISGGNGGNTGGDIDAARPLKQSGVSFSTVATVRFVGDVGSGGDTGVGGAGVCADCLKDGYLSCDSTSDCCQPPSVPAALKCFGGYCRTCGKEYDIGCTGGNPGKGDCCAGLLCNSISKCMKCYDKKAQCTGSLQCCKGMTCENSKCCIDTSSSESCADNADCCSGLVCNSGACAPQQAPKPPTPKVSPAQINGAGTVSCFDNCVANGYRWKKDAVLKSWAQGNPAPYDCLSEGCSNGQKIYLQTRNCNAQGACTESDWSSPSNVVIPPPPPIPIPVSNYLEYMLMALLLAIGLLALAYMTSKAFSLPHWVPLIGDELVQVLATGVVALCLVGITIAINNYVTAGLVAATPQSATITPDGSNQIYQAAYTMLGGLGVNSVLSQLQITNSEIAVEASKGVYCSMLGVGFTLVNCSPLNAFRGTLTSAAFTTVVGLVDIYAQQFLLTLAARFSFSLIIPVGLFFRCFKPTRAAGGALIAIGFGFYTAYPLVIVATTNLLVNQSIPLALPGTMAVPQLSSACDPYETNIDNSRTQFLNYAQNLSEQSVADSLTYLVMVKVIFLSILNLIITLGFINALAKVLGSDIDLSGLARIG